MLHLFASRTSSLLVSVFDVDSTARIDKTTVYLTFCVLTVTMTIYFIVLGKSVRYLGAGHFLFMSLVCLISTLHCDAGSVFSITSASMFYVSSVLLCCLPRPDPFQNNLDDGDETGHTEEKV